MRSICRITVLLLLLVCLTTQAQDISITLGGYHGIMDDGGSNKACAGTNIIFYWRATNNSGANITAMFNGFRVYSPDGADWGTTVGRWIIPEADPPWFDLVQSVIMQGVTGEGADTIGFAAATQLNDGMPDGSDDLAFMIAVGPFTSADLGRTICIDSCFVPPAGNWMWDPVGVPSWDGPYCYEIFMIPCGDTDMDGATDGCDNCGMVYNPDQADHDYDGIGDACCCEKRGDADHNGIGPDIADLIFMVTYMFQEGPSALCMADLDVNGSYGEIDIEDLIYLVTFMFQEGPALVPCTPPEPSPCG